MISSIFNVLLKNKIVMAGIICICVGLIALPMFLGNDKGNDDLVDNSNNNGNNVTGEEISKDETTNITYDENGAFLFAIEDVVNDEERGFYVDGIIERGKVKVGDSVQIVGLGKEIITTTVISIRMSDENKEEVKAGDKVQILLANVTEKDVVKGQVLAEPNSIADKIKFDADIYMFKTEDGGRKTPIYNNYRPQFFFRTIDISGTIELSEGVEMVYPGENSTFKVTLTMHLPIEVGSEFRIMEGKVVVGKGKVTRVY